MCNFGLQGLVILWWVSPDNDNYMACQHSGTASTWYH